MGAAVPALHLLMHDLHLRTDLRSGDLFGRCRCRPLLVFPELGTRRPLCRRFTAHWRLSSSRSPSAPCEIPRQSNLSLSALKPQLSPERVPTHGARTNSLPFCATRRLAVHSPACAKPTYLAHDTKAEQDFT